MSQSIVAWLNAEVRRCSCHSLVSSIHLSRSLTVLLPPIQLEGEDSIMSIMMQVASDLEEDWKLYDKDAFVNAWDISNYVSDYLTKRAGGEGCECSNKIY
jgi:hypothetical protein